MDRQIVYPGSIPLDTDVLNIQRNIMIALGALAQVALGTNTVADGLLCSATQPASMAISVGPGSITQYGVVDINPFGSLPALPNAPLLRIAASITPTTFQLTAPTGAGQAINYLIEASFLEDDATPVVLPYYNASDPTQPYSGPNNSGLAQNTQRLQQVQLQLKVGAPAPIGSQTTPPVDAGWAGLYVITVITGQTAVTSANIVQLATAPFITWKLPQLSPGTQNLATYTTTSQGNWTVPAGISAVRIRVWGGGGAGGSGLGGAGGGGAAGGYSEGYYSVVAGQIFAVTVGGGGIGSGTAGGPSAFGSIASATGGRAGANGAGGIGGAGAGSGGSGFGSTYVVTGQAGGAALQGATMWLGGSGGASFAGAGAMPVAGAASGSVDGNSCSLPGGGGGGGVGGGLGGQGGAGLVLIEW
jgi:hypothetical protein